jgi:RNA recognition motif-containing protein
MSAHKLGKHARGVDGAVTIQAKFGSAASFQSALWDGGVAKSLKEREKGLDAGMELLFGNNSAGGSGALASMFEDVPNIVPMQAHVPNPFPKSGKAPAVLAVVGEGDPVEADAINAGWKERIQSERAAASLRQKRVMRTSSGKLKAVDQSKRTLFVGNLPVSVRQKTVAQLFKGYGKVESVRFRSFAVKDLKMSRKAAFINKHFHESRDTCNAYVVFVEEDSVTLKRAVTEKNGTVVDGKYIRVDLVTGQAENPQHDTKATVFVGNLPFEITETQLREHFCGACNLEGVVNIRCVRDATTSLGKGIAFVQFDSEETAQAALTVHDTILQGTKRKLRVFRASAKASKRKLDAPQGNDRGPEDGGHRGPKRKRWVCCPFIRQHKPDPLGLQGSWASQTQARETQARASYGGGGQCTKVAGSCSNGWNSSMAGAAKRGGLGARRNVPAQGCA